MSDNPNAEPGDFTHHLGEALKERRKQIEALFPEGFVEHGKQADKQTLLAISALVNGVADRIEQWSGAGSTKPKAKSTRKAKVQVD